MKRTIIFLLVSILGVLSAVYFSYSKAERTGLILAAEFQEPLYYSGTHLVKGPPNHLVWVVSLEPDALTTVPINVYVSLTGRIIQTKLDNDLSHILHKRKGSNQPVQPTSLRSAADR